MGKELGAGSEGARGCRHWGWCWSVQCGRGVRLGPKPDFAAFLSDFRLDTRPL